MTERDSQILERLVALASGELEPGDARQVEASIAGNKEAMSTLADLRTIIGAMRADAAPVVTPAVMERLVNLYQAPAAPSALDRWIDQARRLVMTLVHDSHGPMAAAGLRRGTGADVRQLAFESGEVRLDVQVKQEVSGGDVWVIRGQAASPAGGFGDVAAVPTGATTPAAVASCDERGRFKLQVPSGEFDLLVALKDQPRVLAARVKAESA